MKAHVAYLNIDSGDPFRTVQITVSRRDKPHRVPASDLPADIRAALLDWLEIDPDWSKYRCPFYWGSNENRCKRHLNHEGDCEFPKGGGGDK